MAVREGRGRMALPKQIVQGLFHWTARHPEIRVDNPVLVEVTRGDRLESTHRGAVAISDAQGNVLLALGDVGQPLYPRSSVKPRTSTCSSVTRPVRAGRATT